MPKPSILVAPLDWGIGHATRCVPIIQWLLARDVKVIMAADGRPHSFLQAEFPFIPIIRYPGFKIRYPADDRMAWTMIRSMPGLIQSIREEHRLLKKLIRQFNITGIISDNRYGTWHRDIPSVLISHQLYIRSSEKLQWLEPMLHRITRLMLNPFDAIWIPDYPGEHNLSGALAHHPRLPEKAQFIGPLSRFSHKEEQHPKTELDVLAIVSGPEPQRELFEQNLIQQLKETNLKSVILCGKPEIQIDHQLTPHLRLLSHTNTKTLHQLIQAASLIICRPGYTSVMDLVALNKSAVFIPTPGQTEQEYLARYFHEKGWYCSMKQDRISLSEALSCNSNFSGFPPPDHQDFLSPPLQAFLDQCS